MKKPKFILFIVLVLGIGVLFTACTSKNEESSGDITASNTEQADSPYDELVTCVSVDLGVLNPMTDKDIYEKLGVFGLVYESLVNYNNGQFEPGLAESWEISADKTEYTFHLRKDVTFTDGSKFTAQAVKKNFESILMNFDIWGWLGVLTHLDNIEIIDENTIKLNYKKPYYAVLYDLSAPCPLRMVSPQVFPADGNARRGITAAVGTGQWILTESVKDKYYVFTRNEDYWGEKPKYKKIIVKVIPNADTRMLALRSGEVDIIYGSNLVSQEAFNQLKQDKNFIGKISQQSTRTRNILMNTNSELLKDLNIRKAMEYGINKQAIIDSVLYGMEEKADFIIPPQIPFCETNEIPYQYNKEKAEELLNQAGWLLIKGQDIRYKDGQPFRLEMIYRKDNGNDKEIAQAYQGLMREIGVDVNIVGYESTIWYSKAMQGEYNLTLNDTYGIPYVPHVFVLNMLKAGIDYPAQQGLPMKDEIDRKIARLFETGDDQEIAEMYDYIFSTLHQNAVNIPLSYQKEVIVFNKNKVKDARFSGLPYAIDVRNIK